MHFLNCAHSDFAASRSAQPSGLLVESWNSPRLLFAHGPEVLAALAGQMLRIRGKPVCDRLNRGATRPHTDAATALGVCVYIEFRDSCSGGPSL